MPPDRFWSGINYAASHEDGTSELTTLKPAGRRVLCLTGSGGRVLDLLTAGPSEVIALDRAPAQNRLLELKLAAHERLEHIPLLAFLGLLPATDRAATYRRLRPRLSPRARAYWDPRSRTLRRGVFYSGRWERFLRGLATPARTARRRLLWAIFDAPSVEAQGRLWRERWDDRAWGFYLAALGQRALWTRVLREPGMRHIPAEVNIAVTLRRRFRRAAETFLFRTSPWAWLVFRGYVPPEGPLPPHLQEASTDAIREHASGVTIVDGELGSYLRNCPARRFDALSVSDFGSYSTDRQHRSIWKDLERVTAPGGVVHEREFMVPRAPPLRHLQRDPEAEAAVRTHDNSVVYEHHVCRRLTSPPP